MPEVKSVLFRFDLMAAALKMAIAAVPLTQGKLNAVRPAFKSDVTPARIARQFGISQSDVRKALAGDRSK
jgi:hypothetical protein